MKKIIIAIIARKKEQTNNKNYVGVYKNYIKKIEKQKVVPIIVIPNSFTNLKYILDLCDGIIAPGGDNYDKYDKYIYNYALKKDKPYLGICLGMQVMSSNLVKVENHYNNYHYINIIKDTILYKIYKRKKILVNSRHLSKITLTNDLTISSLADDKTIESVEVKNKKFILGVQWHPEDLKDDKIFKYFINSIKKDKI